MRPTLPILAAAIGMALFAQSATAATKSVDVKYSDLDLSTKHGRDQLDHRMREAARQVCRQTGVQTGTIVHSKVDEECVRQALTATREQIAAQIQKDKAAGG